MGRQALNPELTRRQAMVFQKPVLLRRTAAANISHALSLRGIDRGERAMRVGNALKLAGLETHAVTPARVLSGGEQQRLCLARALSLDPDILLLDEPTASLDPASTLVIEELLIDAQRRGIKMIVVTHDVGQARGSRGKSSFCIMAASSNISQRHASSISRKATRPARFSAGSLVL